MSHESYALRLARGRRDVAADLVQAAWVRLLASGRREPVAAEVYTAIRSAYVDGWRRDRNARAARERGALPDWASETIAVPGDSARALMARVDALVPSLRAVVLARIEGFSYHEISARLGVPLGTVMSRLSRARDALAGGLSWDE